MKYLARFVNFKGEIKSLERENNSLKRENESLRKLSEDPVTKKIRLAENDPFKLLIEDCIEEVLKHIKVFDLYQMTKVSTLWKSVVENDKRAAKELDEFLTIRITSLKEAFEFASDKRDIEYKHVTFVLIITSNESFIPRNLVSPLVETLCICLTAKWDDVVRTKFSALRELKIEDDSGDGLDWIAKSEFPALTDLTYFERETYECGWHDICFDSMPKLKQLTLEISGYEEKLEEFLDPPFRLEKLACRFYSEKFCKCHAESLKELKCYVLDFVDYENLLLTMTNLESLSIVVQNFRNYNHHALFPLIRNEKITKLEYVKKRSFGDLGFANYLHDLHEGQGLLQTLTSLPGLQTLILHDVLTREILEVAGKS